MTSEEEEEAQNAREAAMSGLEMIEGYGFWHQSKQVRNLINFLHVEFPEASELELRNHVLHYTMVKLTVWMVPPESGPAGNKEPWEQ